MKEERSRSHLIVHWKWSRNKFLMIYCLIFIYRVSWLRLLFLRPTDQPHQNLPSSAYPFFTAFALRYVQATQYAKNELVEFEWHVISVYKRSKMAKCLKSLLWGRGFKSHPVHFFMWWNYGIILSSFLGTVGQIHIKCLESYFLGLLPDKNSFKAIMFIHITAYGKARR